METRKSKFKIDVAFVIDATGSMKQYSGQLKEFVFTLIDKTLERAEAIEKCVEAFRVRVIDFSDFASEGEETIHASEFFTIPDQKMQFEDYLNRIKYEDRGGDIPENGLEALWTAMKSDWVEFKNGENGRHVIVLITDAPPLNLQERLGFLGYHGEDYPEDIQEMEEIWNNPEGQIKLDCRKKRLILLCPDKSDDDYHSWRDVEEWGYTVRLRVTPGEGLKESDLNDIISEILLGW